MVNIKELQSKFDELFADVDASDNFKVWVQEKLKSESPQPSAPSVSAEEIEKKAEEFADEHCDRENLYGWSSEKYAFEEGAKWMQEYAQAQHASTVNKDWNGWNSENMEDAKLAIRVLKDHAIEFNQIGYTNDVEENTLLNAMIAFNKVKNEAQQGKDDAEFAKAMNNMPPNL